ncbi:MAG: tetratricopeptide repeat protein, partial [Acidobacteriota bacterium]
LSLANAQHQSGNHQLAETTLRAILKQTPDNPIALNNLGYFLIERNERIDEAVNLIEQAIKIDPTNSSYLDSLGWGYFKLGKLPEAERYLKEAIRYNPLSATTFEHLGDLYLKQGKEDLAKTAWQKALIYSSDLEGKNRIKAKMAQKSSN